MENNNREYYFITNKFLATTIAYLLQEKFYKFQDKDDKNKTFYSFKNTSEFKEILTLVQNVKKKNIKLK